MELSDLLTFSTVARLGGITRAADELNTVQSNVTQRVKALESEIGTALFERHSRGMTLTGAGRRLLPYAQRMAALSREALLAARDDGEPKGPLAIGSMETTAAVRLPTLLAEFHRRFPAVRLSLRTSTTAELVAGVLNGTLDGAFVAGPIDHAELDATVAFREELVLVTARHIKSPRELRAATPQSGPTALVFRTGCTYRLRRRRHGRNAAAARRGRAKRHRRHSHAKSCAVRGRDALHHPPQRTSIQRAAGLRVLPAQQ
jgi:DNA-binding transcriptional LysR family regulator